MATHKHGFDTRMHDRKRSSTDRHLIASILRTSIAAFVVVLIAASLHAAPAAADWTEPLPVDLGNSLEAVTCTSASTCLALDSAGNLIASDANGLGPAAASAWTTPTPIGFTGNGGTFTAISCPGGLSFCAAFDSNGNVFYSSDPLSQAATWKTYAALNEIFGGNTESGENTDQADALACAPPSSSESPPAFCLVADTHGNLAYTTEITSARSEFGGLTWSPPYSADPSWDEYEPTAITSISCPSSSLCLATDKLGNIIESTDPVEQAQNDEQWTVLNSIDAGAGSLNGSPGVRGISCPSVTLCVAVDGSGNILYTESPAATHQGGWTVVSSLNPEGGITGISCPTTTECVITDQGGDIQYGIAPFNSRTLLAPVVPVVAAASPPPPPPPPARPSISRLTATIHGAQVVIYCSSGSGGCSGSVTLSITEKIVASRIVAFTATRKKAKAKVVVIGRASFDIPSGTMKTISVHYNKTGKSLLHRYHKLRGKVEVVQGAVAVSTTGRL
jgi:hypothetical protein